MPPRALPAADLFRTGNTAFRLAIAKALVPFVFVYSPVMLIVTDGFTWSAFAVTVGGATAGIGLLGAAFTGYLLAPIAAAERWLLGLAALCFISPGGVSMVVGALLAAPVVAHQVWIWRSQPASQ